MRNLFNIRARDLHSVWHAGLHPGRSASWWLRFVLTFAGCSLLLWISRRFLSWDANLQMIWLPAGMAIVAVWRWGFGMLPALVLAGCWPLMLAAPWTIVVSGCVGSAAEVALAVWLLRRLRLSPELERLREILWLIAVAMGLCPAAGGALASVLLAGMGGIRWSQFLGAMVSWWASHALGILTLAPLLLLLDTPASCRNLLQRGREFALLFGCWEMVDWWGLRSTSAQLWQGYPLDHLLNPLLLWAALRFGPIGVALLCPFALLQRWLLHPGGGRASPGVPLHLRILFPLINLVVGWLTMLVLAGVIREAQNAETELQTSTRTLADIVKALPLAVLAVDAHNRVLEWNPATERLFGGQRQELVGNPLPFDPESELGHCMHAPHFAAPLHGVEVAWHDARREVRRRLRLYSARIELPPAPMGAMVLMADVTAQQELEQRLQQAEKLEKIGRLAGAIAQDLQRLLRVIRDESEEIAAEASAASVHKRAEEMHATSNRAFALIRQLQAFSRRQPVESGEVDLHHAILSRLTFLRNLAGSPVTVTTKLTSRHRRVFLNGAQLDQVLLNLVTNARDAMPGGGRLELTVLDGPDAGGTDRGSPPCVRLIVTDTGNGMPPEVQARIFEPFFTTKGVGRGTGLGLATVYGIVQQVGGSIQVWSQPGAGTRFDILLPCAGPDDRRPSQ